MDSEKQKSEQLSKQQPEDKTKPAAESATETMSETIQTSLIEPQEKPAPKQPPASARNKLLLLLVTLIGIRYLAYFELIDFGGTLLLLFALFIGFLVRKVYVSSFFQRLLKGLLKGLRERIAEEKPALVEWLVAMLVVFTMIFIVTLMAILAGVAGDMIRFRVEHGIFSTNNMFPLVQENMYLFIMPWVWLFVPFTVVYGFFVLRKKRVTLFQLMLFVSFTMVITGVLFFLSRVTILTELLQ